MYFSIALSLLNAGSTLVEGMIHILLNPPRIGSWKKLAPPPMMRLSRLPKFCGEYGFGATKKSGKINLSTIAWLWIGVKK